MIETDTKGHSEEYFGDCRDYWYNQDFLELMAKRWELEMFARCLMSVVGNVIGRGSFLDF